MEFKDFKTAIQKQFNIMKEHQLFRMNIDKDLLWETYLSSFPDGTNPIYKERTEHDCSACRYFIQNAGSMVAIIDNKPVSIWDGIFEAEYKIVADVLSALVKSVSIENVFLHFEQTIGTDKNYALNDDGSVSTKTFNHLYIQLPNACFAKNADIGTKLSEFRATQEVLYRGLNEITLDACQTVDELIAQNSLYRGTEHTFAVHNFSKLKTEFDKLKRDKDKQMFCWSKVVSTPQSVTKIRNTAIGTLLIDLSEGKEIEDAVKMFESKVAPSNYKRPTSLITKSMIESARKKIEELGLTSALERRFATLADININNVLFANRNAKKKMDSNIFDELTLKVKDNVKNLDKVEEIIIENFINNVLPNATSVEVMFDNKLTSNLVSLIAPVDLTAKNMFKWNNNFSWSYTGDVADSMRERVQQAGGRVDGCLRFTHSWNHPEVGRNASLMDLHVFMPNSSPHREGCHDSYPTGQRVGWNNRTDFASGGKQDVDYVQPAPENYVPIENIAFPDINKLKDGLYTFKIHNWSLREPTTSGFKAEIEFGGQVFQYEVTRPLKHKEWITLAEVTLKDKMFTIVHKIDSSVSVRELWNISTQSFQNVSAIMLSPNCWRDASDSDELSFNIGNKDKSYVQGNKHYFFMLENCVNDGTARGFYNEFFNEELNKHRKVLEVVGSKMKTEKTTNQMSGLGFSSTQKNSILVRVKGSFTRMLKIMF